MAHERLTWSESDSIPAELDSSEAKLVYLYLDAADEATVDELREDLEIKRLALLSVLDLLESEGFVECDERTYRCIS